MAFSVSYIYSIVDQYSGKLAKIRKQTDKFTRGTKKAQKATKALSQKLLGMQSTLGSIAGAIGGTAVLGVFNDFETSMNKLGAVTLANTSNMDRMRKMAKDLGATTQFTAGQAAQGMTFLAMAGLDTNQVLKAIPASLQLAAAGGIDLAAAADIATNVMAQMGLQVKDLTRVNDNLALIQARANTNVTEAAEALKNVGTFASSVGIDLEQLTAIIGAMANAGVKGGEAGTLLRNAIQDMVNPTRKQLKAFRRMRVNLREFVDRSTGKIKNISGLIDKLNQSGAKAGLVMTAFGDRGGRAILALQKIGGPALEKLIASQKKAGGTAQRMAEIQMKGLPGLLKTLKSVVEALIIAIFESGLAGWIQDIGNRFIGFTRKIKEVNPVILKWAGALLAAVVVGGPILIFLGLMASALSSVLGVIGAVGSIVGAVFVATTSPIGLAIVAIGALSGAIYLLNSHWDAIKNGIKRAIEDPMEAAISVVNSLSEALTRIKSIGTEVVAKISQMVNDPMGAIKGTISGLFNDAKGLFGFENESVSSKAAKATSGNINGRIDVVGSGGAKATRAEMNTDIPGNLGFNMAGAGG